MLQVAALAAGPRGRLQGILQQAVVSSKRRQVPRGMPTCWGLCCSCRNQMLSIIFTGSICFVSSPGRVFDVCGPICTGNATGLLGKSSGVMSELITMREAMHTDNAMTQRQLALMQDENRYRVSLSLLTHLEKN